MPRYSFFNQLQFFWFTPGNFFTQAPSVVSVTNKRYALRHRGLVGWLALELWVQPPGKGASLCSFQSLRTRPECKCHSLGQLQRGQHGGIRHVPHDVNGGDGLRCHPEPLLAAQRSRETRSC